MGQIHGSKGTIGVGSNALQLDNFVLNRSQMQHETQDMGSTSDFKEREPGLRDWSVQASGLIDKTDTQQLAVRDQLEDGSASNIALLMQLTGSTAGETYNGNARVASDVLTHNVSDMVRWSCTFEGNGELHWNPAT